MTMIAVTHEMGLAREVADHVVFMDDGVSRNWLRQVIGNPKSNAYGLSILCYEMSCRHDTVTVCMATR